MGKLDIYVGYEGDIKGNDNFTLQKAIDKAHNAGGGNVYITSGNYLMHDSLHIKSNVAVTGLQNVKLIKAEGIHDKIVGYLGFNHLDIFVKNPNKFKKGMGVYITDDRSCCFYDTVATIIDINDNNVLLDKPLNHDIAEKYNGLIHTTYPMVSFLKSENAFIKNIIIEGNYVKNMFCGGCRVAGVYMMLSKNIEVSDMTITNFNGDGISYQQCIDIKIYNNRIINNQGNGIHPGSGSVKSIIEKNNIKDNIQDGIFFCLRVSCCTVNNNNISDNKRNGISIGHRDIKLHIKNNKLLFNKEHGVLFRDEKICGENSIIENNVFEKNDIKIVNKINNIIIKNNIGCAVNITTDNNFKVGYTSYVSNLDDKHLDL